MASAPACSICCAYFVHPPTVAPFRLAMMGMSTASLALRMCSRYPSGPRRNSPAGEIGQRLGKALGARGKMIFELQVLLPQLFLEQRIEHDGGGACVFQAANAVNFLGERGRRSHQRRAQCNPRYWWLGRSWVLLKLRAAGAVCFAELAPVLSQPLSEPADVFRCARYSYIR